MSENALLELIYKETLGIKEQQINTNRRLDAMDERFDGIDRRLDAMDERFDGIDRRLDAMDERFDGIDRRLDAMDERLDGMDQRIGSLTIQVSDSAKRLKNIEMTLENEIRPNIMRVAEAHLDLNRKLEEVLKNDQERERIVLKLNFLDGEVRRLKGRGDCLA